IPMPAVTLKHSTTHSSQNCGVLIAFRAETLPSLISEPTGSAVGRHPVGFQSSAGTRMSSHPSDMNTAYPTQWSRTAMAIPPASGFTPVAPKAVSIEVDYGAAIIAPPPKPMMAIPVARPGRSGNHLINVDTGDVTDAQSDSA